MIGKRSRCRRSSLAAPNCKLIVRVSCPVFMSQNLIVVSTLPVSKKRIVAREDEPIDIELVTFNREEFFAALHIPHQRLHVHISGLL